MFTAKMPCAADDFQLILNGLPQLHVADSPGFQVSPGCQLSYSAILKYPFNNHPAAMEEWMKAYGYQACYWIRFSLENTTSQTIEAYLHVDFFGKIVLYALIPGDTLQYTGGPDVSSSPHTPIATLHAIRFQVPAHQQIQYLVQLSSTSDDDLGATNLEISSPTSLSQSFLRQYFHDRLTRLLQLLFLGFMCSQMLYVLFQWMIVKRKEYPYYFLYLGLVTLYYLHKYYHQIGIYWPFAYYPELRFYLKSILLMLPYLFYLKFIRNFLELSTLDKNVERQIIRLENGIVIYMIVDLLLRTCFPEKTWINELLMISIFIVFMYCLYLIFLLMKHHDLLISLILTGGLIAGAGGVAGILITLLQNNLGIVHTNLNSLVTGQIGVCIETIIFTTSLGIKTRRIEKEKIKNQQKLIQQLQENELLRMNMENIRNKIAQDLHDDIGATLSSILLYSHAAMQRKKMSTQEAKAIFDKINRISTDMMENMSDIVWAIHPLQDSMEKLIHRMIYYALPLARAKNITFHFHEGEQVRDVELDMNKRKNIFLIFKEAICNALKYAEATVIDVNLYLNDGQLHLVIKDNGKGFAEQHTEGNGLRNMKYRCRECDGDITISSAPGQGTCIHLQIPVQIR